ncbi:MAG TPA: hypothetical protein VNJ04_08310 [Gemmatimonadaceae bacterium]|nr:hypothetical protein [Gemmatimonadaceae bacterium]
MKDLLIDIRYLCRGNVANLPAARGMFTKREQLFDLGKLESERLRVLDEPDQLYDIRRVFTVARFPASRGREKSSPLVIPQSLDIHPGGSRHFANPHFSPLSADAHDTPYTLV